MPIGNGSGSDSVENYPLFFVSTYVLSPIMRYCNITYGHHISIVDYRSIPWRDEFYSTTAELNAEMQRSLNTTNTEMDQNVALVIRRYNLSLLRQFAKRTANLNVRTAAMKNMPIIPNWKRSEDQTRS